MTRARRVSPDETAPRSGATQAVRARRLRLAPSSARSAASWAWAMAKTSPSASRRTETGPAGEAPKASWR
ncbi:MAG: hypothetical protein KA419_13405 [Acidobacteria bacterium]|nr:hypothetical protein [Acidobacteriota bacterium]